jgi:hypothetical protein
VIGRKMMLWICRICAAPVRPLYMSVRQLGTLPRAGRGEIVVYADRI